MKSFTGRVQWVFFFYEECLILSSSLLLSKLLILLVRKYWGVLSWSEISDFILHIHDFVFVCPPNTQSLSLIENERKSSILICSLLCAGAFPEIRCKCDDFSFLAISIATVFHKLYILVDTWSSTPSVLSLTAFWKPQASIKLIYFHFLHDDDVASFVIRASSNRFHGKSRFQVKQAITLPSSHSSFCNGVQISGIHTTAVFLASKFLKKVSVTAWQFRCFFLQK